MRVLLAVDDEDGDAIEVRQPSSYAGTMDIDRVTRTDGGLEVTLGFRPHTNYVGEAHLLAVVVAGDDSAWTSTALAITPVNDRPRAAPDAFATAANTPLVLPSWYVLANDDDGEDQDVAVDPLAITSVEAKRGGTATLAGDTITFVPAADFVGVAAFTYRLEDGAAYATATVEIAVGTANDAPSATEDVAHALEGSPVVFAPHDLIENDRDLDGQTLTVIAVANPTLGTVQVDRGTVTFTPDAQTWGTGGFDYTITDGRATAVGHVTVHISPGI